MLKRQAGWHTDPPMAEPGIDSGAALIEGHRLAGFVTEGRHRHGAQLTMAHGGGNPAEVQLATEQFGQWRAVEQRHRHLTTQPEQAVADKTTGLAQHAWPITAVHLMSMKALPNAGQPAHGFGEVQRAAGEPHRADSTGRST